VFLARRSIDHRFGQRVVQVNCIGEMFSDMRGHRAGQQHFSERPVAPANILITESVNASAAAYAKRSGALQDETAYRIFAFSELTLKCCRTHWLSIRLDVPDMAPRLDPAL
jgi:hypothetical protein